MIDKVALTEYRPHTIGVAILIFNQKNFMD